MILFIHSNRKTDLGQVQKIGRKKPGYNARRVEQGGLHPERCKRTNKGSGRVIRAGRVNNQIYFNISAMHKLHE